MQPGASVLVFSCQCLPRARSLRQKQPACSSAGTKGTGRPKSWAFKICAKEGSTLGAGGAVSVEVPPLPGRVAGHLPLRLGWCPRPGPPAGIPAPDRVHCFGGGGPWVPGLCRPCVVQVGHTLGEQLGEYLLPLLLSVTSYSCPFRIGRVPWSSRRGESAGVSWHLPSLQV